MALNVHLDVHLTSQFQIRIVVNDTDLKLRPLPDKRPLPPVCPHPTFYCADSRGVISVFT
jgi:hypothetical protein